MVDSKQLSCCKYGDFRIKHQATVQKELYILNKKFYINVYSSINFSLGQIY